MSDQMAQQCRPPTFKEKVGRKLHELHYSKPVRAVYYWLFYSWAYAPLQRFLHRRGWHHMTQAHLPDGVLHHCHWCGIRHLEPYWDHQLKTL